MISGVVWLVERNGVSRWGTKSEQAGASFQRFEAHDILVSLMETVIE
jgi:hypothetical protein